MEATLAPPIDVEKAAILIVDDRPDGLFTLQAVLEAPGYHLIEARSGFEALAHLRRHKDIAVILLDVQMPRLDGFNTARLIKKIDGCEDIPIIFVTAINKDDSHIYRGYASGAVDYIFKPFDPEILRSKVAVFVDLHRKTKKIKEQALRLQESERRERERAMAQMEIDHLRRYKYLADAIAHIIIKVDSDTRPQLFNRPWYEYTGFTLEESEKNWLAAFNPDDAARLFDVWKQAMQTRTDFEIEARLRDRATQLDRWFLIRASAERNSLNETTGWILTCTDIHERKKAEEENRRLLREGQETLAMLKERSRALERSNHELEQFAYVASHDLQEPLRKITNYTDLLRIYAEEWINEKTGRYLDIIIDNVKRMNQLICDLLQLSRVGNYEDGDVDVQKEVASVVEALCDPQEVEVTIGSLPTIKGSATEIRQLFQNLIGNAIKFKNKEEAPKIEITAQQKEDVWTFAVKDNGIGIPPEYQERIFIIFQRLHSKHDYPGTGIGLAICKKIVESYGGKIWVESEVMKGSTFYFTLPAIRQA